MPTRTELKEVPTKRKPSIWREYADGSVWEFQPGVDFKQDSQTFSNAARQWGYNNKFSVSTSVTENGNVYVQFTPNPDAKQRKKAATKKSEQSEQSQPQPEQPIAAA